MEVVTPELLAKRLNDLIANDERPAERRNVFSKRSGQKRTHVQSVRVLPLMAGALPIKQENQTSVAHAGDTAWGTFTSGPLTAEAINQGQLADCYLLIAMLLVARLRANFFDDIFVKVDARTAVVQWFYGGAIIQVRTSLLISTDYDHPTNGDVRPELAEKTWCLIRAGLSDYADDNEGLIYSVFTALGLDGSLGTLNSDAIIAALQAGKAVGLQTTPTVTGKNSLEDWVQSHAYGVVAFDAATKNLTLVQPWYAVKQIAGVDPATVAGGKVFNLVHVGAFPAVPRILASMVNLGAVPAVVVVGPDVVPPVAPPIIPIPLPAEGVTLSADKAATLSHCRLEMQEGKPDIGFVSGAAYAEYSLNVAAGGTYTMTVNFAAVTAAAVDVAVNGIVQAAAVTVAATGAWGSFVPRAFTLTLPAGLTTVRISNRAGASYNIGDVHFSRAVVSDDDPIVAIAVVTKRRSGVMTTTAVL